MELTGGYGSDTQIWIYENSFNPLSPLTNVLSGNEDYDYMNGDLNANLLSHIDNITLTAGTTYVLVVTTYEAGDTGSVVFSVTGPGSVGVSGSTVTSAPDDTDAPTASVTTATLANTANAVVQSSETGTAYIVKDTVTVTDLASITGAADNNFNSVAISSINTNTNLALTGLVDGTYKVYTVDAAGNLSDVSTNTVTIDTTAPSAPSAPNMSTDTDSGTSNSDNNTNNTTPTFTGTAEANATVTLYDTNGSTVLGTTTAGGDGAWSITSSVLSAGAHTLTTKATDTAGNVSDASSSLSVTIDASAAAPSAPDMDAGTDSGTNSDNNT
jgi:hypothetical protein